MGLILDKIPIEKETYNDLSNMKDIIKDLILFENPTDKKNPFAFVKKGRNPKNYGGFYHTLNEKIMSLAFIPKASPEEGQYEETMIKIAELEDELTSKSANLKELSQSNKPEEYSKAVKSIQATSITLSQLSEKAKKLKKIVQLKLNNNKDKYSYDECHQRMYDIHTKLYDLCDEADKQK